MQQARYIAHGTWEAANSSGSSPSNFNSSATASCADDVVARREDESTSWKERSGQSFSYVGSDGLSFMAAVGDWSDVNFFNPSVELDDYDQFDGDDGGAGGGDCGGGSGRTSRRKGGGGYEEDAVAAGDGGAEALERAIDAGSAVSWTPSSSSSPSSSECGESSLPLAARDGDKNEDKDENIECDGANISRGLYTVTSADESGSSSEDGSVQNGDRETQKNDDDRSDNDDNGNNDVHVHVNADNDEEEEDEEEEASCRDIKAGAGALDRRYWSTMRLGMQKPASARAATTSSRPTVTSALSVGALGFLGYLEVGSDEMVESAERSGDEGGDGGSGGSVDGDGDGEDNDDDDDDSCYYDDDDDDDDEAPMGGFNALLYLRHSRCASGGEPDVPMVMGSGAHKEGNKGRGIERDNQGGEDEVDNDDDDDDDDVDEMSSEGVQSFLGNKRGEDKSDEDMGGDNVPKEPKLNIASEVPEGGPKEGGGYDVPAAEAGAVLAPRCCPPPLSPLSSKNERHGNGRAMTPAAALPLSPPLSHATTERNGVDVVATFGVEYGSVATTEKGGIKDDTGAVSEKAARADVFEDEDAPARARTVEAAAAAAAAVAAAVVTAAVAAASNNSLASPKTTGSKFATTIWAGGGAVAAANERKDQEETAAAVAAVVAAATAAATLVAAATATAAAAAEVTAAAPPISTPAVAECHGSDRAAAESLETGEGSAAASASAAIIATDRDAEYRGAICHSAHLITHVVEDISMPMSGVLPEESDRRAWHAFELTLAAHVVDYYKAHYLDRNRALLDLSVSARVTSLDRAGGRVTYEQTNAYRVPDQFRRGHDVSRNEKALVRRPFQSKNLRRWFLSRLNAVSVEEEVAAAFQEIRDVGCPDIEAVNGNGGSSNRSGLSLLASVGRALSNSFVLGGSRRLLSAEAASGTEVPSSGRHDCEIADQQESNWNECNFTGAPGPDEETGASDNVSLQKLGDTDGADRLSTVVRIVGDAHSSRDHVGDGERSDGGESDGTDGPSSAAAEIASSSEEGVEGADTQIQASDNRKRNAVFAEISDPNESSCKTHVYKIKSDREEYEKESFSDLKPLLKAKEDDSVTYDFEFIDGAVKPAFVHNTVVHSTAPNCEHFAATDLEEGRMFEEETSRPVARCPIRWGFCTARGTRNSRIIVVVVAISILVAVAVVVAVGVTASSRKRSSGTEQTVDNGGSSKKVDNDTGEKGSEMFSYAGRFGQDHFEGAVEAAENSASFVYVFDVPEGVHNLSSPVEAVAAKPSKGGSLFRHGKDEEGGIR